MQTPRHDGAHGPVTQRPARLGPGRGGAAGAGASSRRQFESLDLLRAIASIAVLLWHVPPLRFVLLHTAYVSVDLFFLISGFIVAHAYERRLSGSALSLVGFFKVRAIRLYPLYGLGSLLGIVVIAWSIRWGGGALSQYKELLLAVLPAAFLVPVPRHQYIGVFPLNLPAWSLCFEVIANVLYAVFILKATNKALLAIAAASAAALVLVAARYGSVDFGGAGWHTLLGLPRVGYTFAVGVLLYRWWSHRGEDLPSIPWAVPPLAFLILIACPVSAALRPLYDATAVLVVIPLIGVCALCTRLSRTAQAASRAGADLSYPLYMVHVPVIMLAEAAIRFKGASPAVAFSAAVCTALLLGVVADRWFDRPVRRRLTARFVGAWTAIPSPAPL